MSAYDIVKATIRAEYDKRPVHKYPTEGALTDAIMAALSGRYAVVELPVREMNRWSISAVQDLWVEDGEVCQILPQSSGSTIAYRSPKLVRQIAAALLAAADAAEQVTA